MIKVKHSQIILFLYFKIILKLKIFKKIINKQEFKVHPLQQIEIKKLIIRFKKIMIIIELNEKLFFYKIIYFK